MLPVGCHKLQQLTSVFSFKLQKLLAPSRRKSQPLHKTTMLKLKPTPSFSIGFRGRFLQEKSVQHMEYYIKILKFKKKLSIQYCSAKVIMCFIVKQLIKIVTETLLHRDQTAMKDFNTALEPAGVQSIHYNSSYIYWYTGLGLFCPSFSLNHGQQSLPYEQTGQQ